MDPKDLNHSPGRDALLDSVHLRCCLGIEKQCLKIYSWAGSNSVIKVQPFPSACFWALFTCLDRT